LQGLGFGGIITAIAFTEHAHVHVVAAAPDTERVERLMQVADEMHDELQCGSPVGTIELEVTKPLLPIGNAIDDAIAPAIGARTGGNAGLPRTVAIAIVTGRGGRDIDVVPERCLLLITGDGVGPTRHISQ